MLCFQQLTQLNLVIAVENTLTRANSFNLSDPPAVMVVCVDAAPESLRDAQSELHPVRVAGLAH